MDLVDVIKAATHISCILTGDKEMCELSDYTKNPEVREFSKGRIEDVTDVLLEFSYFALLQASSDIAIAEEASSQLTWANLEAKLKPLQ